MIAHRHGSRTAAPPRTVATEVGDTLVEVLIAVALMGVAFTVLLQGLFTVVRVSDANQQRSLVSLAIENWAELMQAPVSYSATPPANPLASFTYRPCAPTSGVYPIPTTSGGTLPAGYTATITQIRYFTGTYNSSGQPNWTSSITTCQTTYQKPVQGGDPYNKDNGMQEITLRVDTNARSNRPISGGAGGRAVDQITIIKRDQRCPYTFDNADLGPC